VYGDADDAHLALHGREGRLVLLQEAWGDRTAPDPAFYQAEYDADLTAARGLTATDRWVTFELADPPAAIATDTPVRVCATIAGVAVDSWMASPSDGEVRAGALRRELCTRAGFELCRIVVREGLLGQRIAGGGSLRDRLRAAAAARGDAAAAATTEPVGAPEGFALAPGWEGRARTALADCPGHVIGRRHAGTVGLSASRPAALPRLAAEEALAAARVAGDPVVIVGRPGPDAPLAYAPELVWHDAVEVAGAMPVAGWAQDEPAEGRR